MGVQANLELKNIVLFVVDCARQDMFFHQGAASFINEMGDRGIKLNNAISPYNQTQTSIASMFTGKLPSEHLIQSYRDDRFDVPYPVLPEILKSRGYNTYGVVTVCWLHPMFGWNRGFDFYHCGATFNEGMGCGGNIHSFAAPLLEKVKEPFFVYLHSRELHAPYVLYPKAIKGEFENEYLASLKYLDMQLNSFVYDLYKNYPNTMVVITADHGVGLGDYDNSSWAQGPNAWVYDCVIHTPTIIFGNGITPAKVDRMFSTKDIYHLLVDGRLVLRDFAISESYAYHNESCIDERLNARGKERAMKGYRCVVSEKHKLIEGEDEECYLVERTNEDCRIENDQVFAEMKGELYSSSNMDLKARRGEIVAKKMKGRLDAFTG